MTDHPDTGQEADPDNCSICSKRGPEETHDGDCPNARLPATEATRGRTWTVHRCLDCGKLCGDRDGWEAHKARGERGEFDHPDDYRWDLIEVVEATPLRTALEQAEKHADWNYEMRAKALREGDQARAERDRAESALESLRGQVREIAADIYAHFSAVDPVPYPVLEVAERLTALIDPAPDRKDTSNPDTEED